MALPNGKEDKRPEEEENDAKAESSSGKISQSGLGAIASEFSRQQASEGNSRHSGDSVKPENKRVNQKGEKGKEKNAVKETEKTKRLGLGKKEKTPKEKKSFEEMDASERREAKEKQKKNRKVAGIAVGIVTLIAATWIFLTVDLGSLFGDDSEGGDGVVDDGEDISGRGGVVDEGGDISGGDGSASASQGFPRDLPNYLQWGHESPENQAAMSDWEETWADPDTWESLDNEDGEVVWEDWDEEANAPSDPRRELDRDDDDFDAGWSYRDTAEREYRHGFVGDLSQAWPSRERGYVNNPENYELEDGSSNPWYSYVLAEDIQWFFGHNLQKLLNPVYGGWQTAHDDVERLRMSAFVSASSDQWWQENIEDGDISNLPIYADWDGDGYGGIGDEVGRHGWFGEITDTDLEIFQTDDGMNAIRGTIYLEYSTIEDDTNNITTRNGALDIIIEPNAENPEDINNRMVISQAELTVQE